MKPSLRKKFKGQRCIVCDVSAVDLCHIRSKGAGGLDADWNIVPMCRREHIHQHRIGWVAFIRRFPKAYKHLEKMGWRVVEVLGVEKMWNDNMEAK